MEATIAGFWNLSRAQQLDSNNELMLGARAYFYQGGTTTPMPVYQDASLALLHQSPVEADADGRFPAVYFDDATYDFYRARVTDASGVEIFDDRAVPIIGQQVGEGGGDVPVDANSVFDTGDVKWRYGTGTLAGWVRCNGRTIGSASSGATERANSDCQDLFEHLWGVDSNLTVTGGRGASAAADWSADKAITLPDVRGKYLFGLDDMGNSAAGVLTGGTTLGETGGEEETTLTAAQHAAHTHDAGTFVAANHGHPSRYAQNPDSNSDLVGGIRLDSASPGSVNQDAWSGTPGDTMGHQIGGSGTLAVTGTSDSQGDGDPHNNLPPYLLMTLYIRL
jgi:microcystin-dependent protein